MDKVWGIIKSTPALNQSADHAALIARELTNAEALLALCRSEVEAKRSASGDGGDDEDETASNDGDDGSDSNDDGDGDGGCDDDDDDDDDDDCDDADGGSDDGGGEDCDDAFIKQWLETIDKMLGTIGDGLCRTIPDSRPANDVENPHDKELVEMLKVAMCIGSAFREIFLMRRVELLMVTALTKPGGGADSIEISRCRSKCDRAVKDLDKLRMVNRGLHSMFLFYMLRPAELGAPSEMHVEMWKKPSLFGGQAYGKLGKAAAEYESFTGTGIMRGIYFPKDTPDVQALLVVLAQKSTDLEAKATAECGESRYDRFNKLVKFLWLVIGTRQQRVLLISASALNFTSTLVRELESYYQQSVLYATVTAMASAAMSSKGSGGAAAVGTDLANAVVSAGGSRGGLLRVIVLITMLKCWGSLLFRFSGSVRGLAHRQIRESLSERVTRHVLAQDLEDVEKTGESYAESPSRILESITDDDTFEYNGFGCILEMHVKHEQRVCGHTNRRTRRH